MNTQILKEFNNFNHVYQHVTRSVETYLADEKVSAAPQTFERRAEGFNKQWWKVICMMILVLMTGMIADRASAAPEQIEKPINIIEVTTTDDILNSVDGLCSLREAIISANENPVGLKAAGECEQGSATKTDRIILQSGLTYQMAIFERLGDDTSQKNDYDIVDNEALTDLQIMPDGSDRAIIKGIGPNFFQPVGFEGWDADRIFDIENATVEFYRLGITNGVAVHTKDGGGIKNSGGHVSIVDSWITQNRSAVGGGIYNSHDGTMYLLGSFVVSNGNHFDVGSDGLTIAGGGIYNSGQLFLQETIISGNRIDFYSAAQPWNEAGGGIYNSGGTITFLPGSHESEIVNNRSVSGGALHNAGGTVQGSHFAIISNKGGAANLRNEGGIVNLNDGFIGFHQTQDGFVNDGNASLTDVWVNGNGEAGIFNQGGDLQLERVEMKFNENSGLMSDGGTVVIDQSQIRDNEALTKKGGGIRLTNGAAATITRSSITNNTAQTAGGIYIFNSSLTMANSTVSGNETVIGIGGGILLQSDGNAAGETVEFFNVTVHDNSSAAGIGSAFSLIGSTIVPETVNSIWSRPPGETTCSSGTGSNPLVSNGHNLSIDGNCFTPLKRGDQINTNPELGPLIELEGTQMHLPLPWSPVIDVADVEACKDTPVNNVDQRGYGRGELCDIGAVEFNLDS